MGDAQRFEVTPLELFFDLVFVFAVSQLSHHLLEHLSWRGALETAVLLLAVYRTWSTSSWDAVLLGINTSGARGLLLVMMWLGLLTNAALPASLDTSPWPFVLPLVAGGLGRSLWMAWRAPSALLREHFQRATLWLAVISAVWIVGAFAPPETRLAWWAGAALLDVIGGWLGHPVPGRHLETEGLPFDGGHMLERNRLFLLIALGETVVTTGTALVASPSEPLTALTGTAALMGTVALWAVLFGRTHTLTLQRLDRTEDPLRLARLATNLQVLVVAGLVALAVANERTITHPQGAPSLALTLLLFGGPLLVRLELAVYVFLTQSRVPQMHLLAALVTLLAGVLTFHLPPFVSLIVSGVMLAALAFPDWLAQGEQTE